MANSSLASSVWARSFITSIGYCSQLGTITLDFLSNFSICRWDTCARRRSIFWSCFRVNLVLIQKPGFSESADTRDSKTEASRFNSLSTVSRYSKISITASSSMLFCEKKPIPLNSGTSSHLRFKNAAGAQRAT